MKSIKLILIFLNIFNVNAYTFLYYNNYNNNPNNYIKNRNIYKFPKLRYNKIHNISMVEKINNNNFVADMQRRTIMNVILLTSSAVPVLWMLTGFLYFLVPPNNNNFNVGIIAKDANGDDIYEKDWIKNNPYPNRNLVQGLKGDAHYLIVKENNNLEKYALNAVCTHLGCVVPWNKAANKFMCPCHGSQYDETGKVIRGPAPLSLALAKIDILDEKVVLSEWKERDFRTNSDPWWIK